MKRTMTVLILTVFLAGTLHAAQTAGDIIKLRHQQKKDKAAADAAKLVGKESKQSVTAPEMRAYFSIGVGPSFSTESKLDTGYALTLALGTDFVEVPARVELEYILADYDFEDNRVIPVKGDVTQHAFMGNLYYDFEDTAQLKPYLFGGLGIAYADGKATGGGASASASETSFAYQAGAGLGYELTDAVGLDIKYRYLGAQDGVDAHNVTFGIRCGF